LKPDDVVQNPDTMHFGRSHSSMLADILVMPNLLWFLNQWRKTLK